MAGVFAQAPFDPSLERQLWKTLLPMGGDLAIPGPDFVPVPRRTNVNTPSPFKAYSWTDENNEEIYRSVTIPSSMPGATQEEKAENAFNAEVDLLRDGSGSLAGNEGACTFSHRDDWDGDGPQWRQCVTGGRLLPPPPGALLDPVGVAVHGTTVYVVDDFNQRVQAFDFEGRVKPMKYPIGNGIPGSGTYSYSNYRPYADFPGYETFDGGYSGSQLKAPNGIAVDAANQIAVADTGNYRIAVFANDGALVVSFPLPGQLGMAMRPTLVAVTPGATILPPGSAIPPGRENDRIVVTDWSHCMVQIYKANFELVRTLPDNLPSSPMHAACKTTDPTVVYPGGTPTFDGEFSTLTGVTIDASGHIYVTDHAQSVVQVFDAGGNTLGWFGKPGVQPAPGALAGPVGVAIDHLGRVGVIDAGNSRVVFYKVSFAPGTNLPAATFEFQLDSVVSVTDFPMGLAEQWGPAADGLDPKGRFLATDPWGKRILRFELPELGIVDAQAAILAQQPAGQPADQLTGHGTFKVAVPRQKEGTVIDVETFVVPVEAGVAVVPGSIVPGNDQVPTVDIGAGEYVAYQFTYTMGASVAQATFTINARGDFDGTTYLAEAPAADARSRSQCIGCDATHEIYWQDQDATPGPATPTTNPVTGAWFPSGVNVRLLPVPADGSISHIGWHYGGASEIFYTQHGETQESPIGSDGYLEVPVAVPGASTLSYWAITNDGRIGDPHTVDLNLDLTNPSVNFLIWPPPTGTVDSAGRAWYNHDVTVGYVATDVHSGTDQDTQSNPAFPDGQMIFTAEGRDQSQNVTITDRVARAASFNSALSTGGRPVNIDKSAPAFDSDPASPIVLTITGEDENGSYAIAPLYAFAVSASDPSLSNGEPGSGVASVTNPGGHLFRYGVDTTWTYTATDRAGNTRSVTVDVVLQPGAPGVSGPDRSVEYGGRAVLRAYVRPRSATGTVTFAVGPYTIVAPVQTVSGGIDPATGVTRNQGEAVAVIDPVTIDTGSYPMTAAYSGDQWNSAASTQMTVTVTPRAVSIIAAAASRVYGAANPALTATVAGVVSGDTLNYTLTSPAIATSPVGAYDISVNLLGNHNYYAITTTTGTLTVTPRPLTVTATAASKIYGSADPSLPYSLTGTLVNGDELSGSLTRAAGSIVGAYPIGIGTLTAGANYAIAFQGANLTITRRDATVTAQDKSKTTAQADPPLTATGTGFLATDSITFSATRTPGNAAGTYVITPSASGAAVGNYNVTYVNGVFTIITDNRPPVCSGAIGGEIWPPNHKKFYAAPIMGVTDPEGQAVTILITGIWQDEQLDSTGDGRFAPDGRGVGTNAAWVRAERNGHQNKAAGNGRIYEILFRATDSKGASCNGSVIWSVPHDQGKGGTAIDSGARYDSTGVIPGARSKAQIHRNSQTP